MNTLKQLQENIEKEFINEFGIHFSDSELQFVLAFLHQQTTLAYEAGKKEVIEDMEVEMDIL